METKRVKLRLARKWQCTRCKRWCRGKAWHLKLAWNGNKPSKRRFCFPCGPVIKEVLEAESKKVDNSHLPLLDI